MPPLDAESVSHRLVHRDYARLEGELSAVDLDELSRAWTRWVPMERLTLFKLLDAARAMELYDRLPVAERYLLFCGLPLQAIAPVLEDLPAAARHHFVVLPRSCYERMFEDLCRQAPEGSA